MSYPVRGEVQFSNSGSVEFLAGSLSLKSYLKQVCTSQLGLCRA